MLSCPRGACRSGARCLDCIERDGLTRRLPRTMRVTFPVFTLDHALVHLAAEGLGREVEKMRRVVEIARTHGFRLQ